ncbi:hypothetical protein JCM16303_002098 [Sporobolomyces ruberrimus]
MQSLGAYGSDSDDESSSPRLARSAPAPVASTSKVTLQSNSPLNPVPPVLNRLKSTGGTTTSTTSSRTNSPLLSGVVSTSRANTPTPRRQNNNTSSRPSASPPFHARASAPRSTENQNKSDLEKDQSGNARSPRGNGNDRQEREEFRDETRPGEKKEPGEEDERTRVGVDLDSLSRFGIPPIPTGECHPAVQAKLNNFNALRQSRGLHFNDSLSSSKAFRNPRIYTKLVEFMDVDETGNCWDKRVWDPKEIGRDGTASRLAELQKLRSEAKQASVGQPNSRSSINFTSSSSSSSLSSKGGGGGDMASRYRERDERDRSASGTKRSRWDNGSTAGGGSASKRDRSRSPRRR